MTYNPDIPSIPQKEQKPDPSYEIPHDILKDFATNPADISGITENYFKKEQPELYEEYCKAALGSVVDKTIYVLHKLIDEENRELALRYFAHYAVRASHIARDKYPELETILDSLFDSENQTAIDTCDVSDYEVVLDELIEQKETIGFKEEDYFSFAEKMGLKRKDHIVLIVRKAMDHLISPSSMYESYPANIREIIDAWKNPDMVFPGHTQNHWQSQWFLSSLSAILAA